MASPEDSLRIIFTSKAAQVLPPITRELADALDLEVTPAHREAVGHALARAFMEGAAVGATEMVAQAAEKGISIDLNWLGAPDGPE